MMKQLVKVYIQSYWGIIVFMFIDRRHIDYLCPFNINCIAVLPSDHIYSPPYTYIPGNHDDFIISIGYI